MLNLLNQQICYGQCSIAKTVALLVGNHQQRPKDGWDNGWDFQDLLQQGDEDPSAEELAIWLWVAWQCHHVFKMFIDIYIYTYIYICILKIIEIWLFLWYWDIGSLSSFGIHIVKHRLDSYRDGWLRGPLSSRWICSLWKAIENGYPLVMTNSLPWYRWPIEIDDLPS